MSASKWKGSIGLRYEYIQAINTDQGEVKNKTNYSDLLPSLSLSTMFGRVGMNLDFSSRVNRPSFRQLNNSVSYNNQYHYEQGNIYLVIQLRLNRGGFRQLVLLIQPFIAFHARLHPSDCRCCIRQTWNGNLDVNQRQGFPATRSAMCCFTCFWLLATYFDGGCL